MATTPKNMEGLVAVSESSEGVLGYICWFSIPDEAIGLRRIKAGLASHGLPLTLAPKDTKAIHTFKRAMREQEGRRRTNGHTTETTIAQVVETSDDCVYQVSRLKRDLNDRVVDYPKAMRVVFNKHTDEIGFRPLGEVPRVEVMDMVNEIESFVEKNSARVTGARVRTMIRRYLRDEPDEQRGVDGLSGENLRGKAGGIYFVAARFSEEISALAEMLSELYGGRAYLHAVPMADSATEREIVRRHHVMNTRQEMKEAMGEVKALLSKTDRAPRSDAIANQWARFHALQRRAAKYREVLDDEGDEIAEMAQILSKQLNKLAG